MNHDAQIIHHRCSNSEQRVFIDLFAGCGGLSLGLLTSGWKGLFAIEKSEDAFKTLCHNLVDSGSHNQHKPIFEWPTWISTAA